MSSKVEIVNLALANLQVAPVNDLTTGPPKIAAISASYDVWKPTCLTMINWSFALKIQQLAQLVGTPDYPNYLYWYQMPTDCLAIWQLFAGAYQPQINYTIIGDRIYSNEPQLWALYIFSQTENKYPPYFVALFAKILAAENCMLFTQNANLLQTLVQQQSFLLQNAAAIDSMQHPVYPIQNFPSINIRNWG